MSLDFYTSKFALVKNGVVENIIIVDSLPTAIQVAQAQGYTDAPVCVDQYFVTIGDKYDSGKFIHDGKEIERQLTLEEENAKLRLDNAELRKAIVELATA